MALIEGIQSEAGRVRDLTDEEIDALAALAASGDAEALSVLLAFTPK